MSSKLKCVYRHAVRFSAVILFLAAAHVLSPVALAQACPDDDLDGYFDCTVPGCDATGLLCGDCDDSDGNTNPAEADVCNQNDDNCDGRADEGSSKPLASMSYSDTANDIPNDRFGQTVAGIGDVTGDGVEDFAVGITGYDGGSFDEGSVLVVSGADRSIHCRATDPAAAGSDQLGVALAGIADLTSDGVPDFIAGVSLDDTVQGSDRGSVILFSGADCSFVRKMNDTGSVDNFVYLGFSVAALDDISGDGLPEIIAGAYADNTVATDAGAAFVYNGATGTEIYKLTDSGDGAASDWFGWSVAGLGDISGDSVPDIAVGSPLDDNAQGSSTGSVLFFSGMDGSLIRKTTHGTGDEFGYSLARLGDVSGDMVPDVAVGTIFGDDPQNNAGEVMLISGADGSIVRTLVDPLGESAANLGWSVARMPDITDDGVDEILAGAYRADPGGLTNAGRAVLFNGATGAIISRLEDPAAAANDELGTSVGVADVTGDREPDALVGVPLAESAEESNVGKVVIFSFEADCDTDGLSPFAGDCDDGDSNNYPGNAEVCGDALDNDCDGEADTDDDDGDGFGVCDSDCDESNPLIYPGAPELCNGVDDDCSGTPDDGGDGDGDTFEAPCDCNDTDAAINPNAAEVCNYADDNCGLVDEGFSRPLASLSVADTANDVPTDHFGQTVAGIGDVTGDGVEDFAVGITGYDGATFDQGSVLVYSGADRAIHCRATDPVGASSDQLGVSLAPIADLTSDGIPDFLVGVWLDDTVQGSDRGSVILFSGADCSFVRKMTDTTNVDNFIYLGWSVSALDDITGDGLPEIIGGAYADNTIATDAGAAFVFNGATGDPIYKLTDDEGRSSDYLGWSVAGLGDVNFDNVPDIAVGAPLDDNLAGSTSGSVVFFSGADGTKIRKAFYGTGDQFGYSLAALGDVDGDGVGDLVSGHPFGEPLLNNQGSVVVISGRDGSLIGEWFDNLGASADNLGWSVAVLPDITGDGIEEIVAGAYRGDPGAGAVSNGGRAVIFNGATGVVVDRLEDPAAAANDELGTSVGVADVTGDGSPDVIVGVPLAESAEESNVGKVVIFHYEADCDTDGLSPYSGDCDDGDSNNYPGNAEVCGDALDNDCDGEVDTDDDDGDGFGVCDMDCDESNPLIYPGAPELCNGVDDDCSGTPDDGGDGDGDTFEAPCDCNDTDAAINPNAAEVCNYADDNCGLVDEGFSRPLASLSVADTANDVPTDRFGQTVAGIGDVTGDGVEDFAVGITGYDGATFDQGSVLVYSGADRSIHCRATDPVGASSDQLGVSLAPIADLTSDGIPDFLVGVWLDDTVQGSDRGSVILFSGADCSFVRKMNDTGSVDNFIYLGISVAALEDVTGDGLPEIIGGAYADNTIATDAGAAFVFNGATGAQIFKLTDDEGRSSDYLGWSVAGLGDVNFDNVPDIAVGAPLDDNLAGSSSGSVVFFSGADGTKIRKAFYGTGDQLGYSLAALGDVDGDGVGDLVSGHPFGEPLLNNQGSVVVISGRDGSLIGEWFDNLGASADNLGWSVAVLPDITGDGIEEIVAGAYRGDPGAGAVSNGGRAVIFNGATGVVVDRLEDPAAAANDELGTSVGVADVTGDGSPDVIVGVPLAESAEESNVGKVMIFHYEADCDTDGLSPYSGDCDDGDSNNYPGNAEVCGDALDNDCDGEVDTDDDDGDGFGVCDSDCDESNPLIYPGAPELCNGIDDDCSGTPDDGGDGDGDTFEAPCDCDDSDAAINPNAAETCDRRDEDCNGIIDDNVVAARVDIKLSDDVNGLANDGLATSLAGVGDINSDGAVDIAVGIPGYDGGGFDRGSVLVYSGRDRTEICRLIDPAAANSDQFGKSVSGIDDLTGDGAPDILVGSWLDDTVQGSDRGSVLLFSGADCTFVRRMTDTTSVDNFIYLGFSVAALEDITGDGLPEVIAGAYSDNEIANDAGAAFVFNGATGDPIYKLTDDEGRASDWLGWSVAGLGDINFDGVPDIAVGAPLDDNLSGGSSGSVVFYSGVDGSKIRKVFFGAGGQFGQALAPMGDVDGDGVEDLVSGRPLADPLLSNQGSVVVVSGRDGSLIGEYFDGLGAASDNLGISVAAIPDITGDGIDDIVGGAYRADPNGSSSGRAVILNGATGAVIDRLTDADGAANDEFGTTVAVIGDIQNGGVAEIVVGAPLDDTVVGNNAGSFVLFSFDEYDCDMDGDGPLDGDCGDADPNIPGPEVCDEADNDCDGRIDEDFDADSDNFTSCSTPIPDCDDTDSAINPGAVEGIGDGVDQNCDTEELCYADGDADTYGDLSGGTVNSVDLDCTDAGEADDALDCNDGDAGINPGATEVVADGVDQDCDTQELCFTDTDADTYGDPATLPSTDLDCTDAGEADDNLDCNDGDAGINPDAAEGVADGVDQNCDTDELCYEDADSDTYGTSAGTTTVSDDLDCVDGGEADDTLDCNDGDAAINPGAIEGIADGVDQNCDTEELCYTDADSDTYGDPATLISADLDCADAGEADDMLDCNDGDAGINPGATEGIADGVDQNCDTEELCYEDGDSDTYGTDAGTTLTSTDLDCTDAGEADDSTDCNDGDAGINPGATEGVGDGIDQDCDTEELCYEDGDNDTYGTDLGTTVASTDLDCADAGEADDSTDCNDGDAGINPGATEGVGDGIDQDCDTEELCYEDGDNDTYGTDLGTTVASTDLDCADAGEADDSTDCNDGDAGINPGATEGVGDGIDQDCDTEELCYTDGDADTYGDPATLASTDLDCMDAGEADDALDCNDGDAGINPGATEGVADGVDQNCDTEELCYVDGDVDTYGASAGTTVASTDLDCVDAGEADDTLDCNDGDAGINPGASEIPGDSVDQNCDTEELCYVDGDGDTYGNDDMSTMTSLDVDCSAAGEADDATDCDDVDAAINPGATEVAGNGIDENCDGSDGTVCYADTDGDTYGDPLNPLISLDPDCTDPGEADDDLDCDDTDAAINPDAMEVPDDGIDQDCNGADTITCFVDADQDTYGDSATTPAADGSCDTADMEADDDLDCNDGDAGINPGATEGIADGVDQNCDTDELCYADADTDTYGTDLATTVTSTDLDCVDAGEADDATDCNDGDAGINPGATEGPGDGVDQDCDTQELCYQDGDADTYGTGPPAASTDLDCTDAGEADDDLDCNDGDAGINPGATEGIADGVDQNCDTEELCYADGDSDTYGAAAGTTVTSTDLDCTDAGEAVDTTDCDDGNAAVNPGATEIPGDSVDQDCDTEELCYVDGDGDTYGNDDMSTVASVDVDCSAAGEADDATDCDDVDPAINPGAIELPGDGIDQDCDGSDLTVCFVDDDGDGVGGQNTVVSVDTDCTDPGESDLDTDCNDMDAAIFPGATEGVADGVDQDCDTEELCWDDADGDTYGAMATVASTDLDCADAGESSNTQDCDDGDAGVNPAAAELPADGVDQNCDTEEACYADQDGDSYGTAASLVTSTDLDCADAGEADDPLDCNDADATINPMAMEAIGDEVDQNCDGQELCWEDLDGDAYGTSNTVNSGDADCTDAGEAALTNDCDDGNAAISPGVQEVCDDTLDNDCDTLIDLLDIFDCAVAVTECSTLGDVGSSEIDQDVWSFTGLAGEDVTLTLAANDNNTGRANLILVDAMGMSVQAFLIDRSTLPNEVTLALPADGEYRIGVVEHSSLLLLPGRPFAGAYCLTVDAAQGAAQTLTPTSSVEGSGSNLAGDLFFDSTQQDNPIPKLDRRPKRRPGATSTRPRGGRAAR